jgi:hypothetical protein
MQSCVHVGQVLQFEFMFDETWAPAKETARQSQVNPRAGIKQDLASRGVSTSGFGSEMVN